MMNEGVKILIERMKTNPDEFIAPRNTGASKWGHLIESYMDSLDDEDQKAIKDGYKEIHQQRFTEAVMTELLAPEEDGSLGKPWYTKQGNVTLSGGQTLGQSSVTLNTNAVWGATNLNPSITLGNTTLEESKLQQLLQMKKELDAQKEKKHKTLFGKLFNYS